VTTAVVHPATAAVGVLGHRVDAAHVVDGHALAVVVVVHTGVRGHLVDGRAATVVVVDTSRLVGDRTVVGDVMSAAPMPTNRHVGFSFKSRQAWAVYLFPSDPVVEAG
jgi:hypothetical protein